MEQEPYKTSNFLAKRIGCSYVKAQESVELLTGFGMTYEDIRLAVEATPPSFIEPWTWRDRAHRKWLDRKAEVGA